ncbi:MAG: HesA/MoeB/ThiF family protein [Pedosphaera sp.]|nr:HesA/MoeB/ThiF family protein [Pedosphaera sp.]
MDILNISHSTPKEDLPLLTAEEAETYSWQLPVTGFGELAQRRLKGASVLISRVGGLGGSVAFQLAAAGVGRLILAHGGNLRANDLNRQLLMTQDHLGKPRIDSAVARLKALNPRLEIIAEASNICVDNVNRLTDLADVVVDCAPLFEERYLLNRHAMAQGKPMVEAAVYDLEFHLTTFFPGRTGCLRCLYPEPSTTWTRRFPVLGAVAGTAGSLAALETIKVITGMPGNLASRLLCCDLSSYRMTFLNTQRVPECSDCGFLLSSVQI